MSMSNTQILCISGPLIPNSAIGCDGTLSTELSTLGTNPHATVHHN